MVIQMQVLSVQSLETAPSLLLSTESQRFLFNVGDGTQRLCMEHHVRLAKLQHILLTELRSHTVGGLPGMILTISDTGKPGLHVHGPVATKKYLNATRHFLYRPQFKLQALEVHSTETLDDTKPHVCYEDQDVIIYAVASANVEGGIKRKFNQSPTTMDLKRNVHDCVSYLIEVKPQKGKFLVEKAMALGVPKGKLFGQLHQGKDVTLADGRVVQSRDCVLPSIPATACLVISCPTLGHVDTLVSQARFRRYQEINGQSAQVQVQVLFHLGNLNVLHSPKYTKWVQTFGPQAQHVLLHHDACPQKSVYRASAMFQAQLHELFPHLFPSNIEQEARDPAKPMSRHVTDVSFGQGSNLVLGESLLKFGLAPPTRRGFDPSNCAARLEVDHIRATVSSFRALTTPQSPKLDHDTHPKEDYLDGHITFLGTGCAIPSKYRNVTGIYVAVRSKPDAEVAGMLLDCGEGTLGQLARAVEGDRDRLQALVNGLKCIWISHNHADHHLGLLRVLSFRDETSPVLVMGPRALCKWLEEYTALDGTIRDKFTFLGNWCLDETHPRAQEPTTQDMAAQGRTCLETTLAIRHFECIPVKHAHESYGVVLTFENGRKVAFSGDCRPSRAFAAKATGACVLIHEATFEDALQQEAKEKAHCTIAEALAVGRQAQAQHLILTHFSQRYPKVTSTQATSDERSMHVLSAMDLLCLPLHDLEQPQLMEVCMHLMTGKEDELETR
ncbi:hypothetical protein PsorP6_015817 [Peronosclerospora sorghi]|uniref:Uncharacterized protein n=1 Tax=Peronosclerospora sorghi TaxID=230839 RepID=A0ACC0WND8_9STRA|nr:hypothetical protein PsorP6_015817 [Peronosclerospora sorghi]